jgi:hypothetical protein
MDKWEYLTVKIWWNNADTRWEVDGLNGLTVNGTTMYDALNLFGAEGWELVNIWPSYWQSDRTFSESYGGSVTGSVVFAVTAWDASLQRGVFKRRVP